MDDKRKMQMKGLHKYESSKADSRDRLTRSSGEVSVMEMERSGQLGVGEAGQWQQMIQPIQGNPRRAV